MPVAASKSRSLGGLSGRELLLAHPMVKLCTMHKLCHVLVCVLCGSVQVVVTPPVVLLSRDSRAALVRCTRLATLTGSVWVCTQLGVERYGEGMGRTPHLNANAVLADRACVWFRGYNWRGAEPKFTTGGVAFHKIEHSMGRPR